MVLILIAIVLAVAALIWLWKVPVKKTVQAMKRNGSSTGEAYLVVALLFGGAAVMVYMIVSVI